MSQAYITYVIQLYDTRQCVEVIFFNDIINDKIYLYSTIPLVYLKPKVPNRVTPQWPHVHQLPSFWGSWRTSKYNPKLHKKHTPIYRQRSTYLSPNKHLSIAKQALIPSSLVCYSRWIVRSNRNWSSASVKCCWSWVSSQMAISVGFVFEVLAPCSSMISKHKDVSSVHGVLKTYRDQSTHIRYRALSPLYSTIHDTFQSCLLRWITMTDTADTAHSVHVLMCKVTD